MDFDPANSQRLEAMQRQVARLLARFAFPVYSIVDPHLGSPMIGDSNTHNGAVNFVGIVYGNPLTDDPVVHVITSLPQTTKTLDELLDIETVHLRERRGARSGEVRRRPTVDVCRVILDGQVKDAAVTPDGNWWALQVDGSDVVVSLVGRGPRPSQFVLEPVRELEALWRDRTRAIAERVRQAQM